MSEQTLFTLDLWRRSPPAQNSHTEARQQPDTAVESGRDHHHDDDGFDLVAASGGRLRLLFRRVFLRDCGAKRSADFRRRLRDYATRREMRRAAGWSQPAAETAEGDEPEKVNELDQEQKNTAVIPWQELQQLPKSFGSKRRRSVSPISHEDYCSDWRLLCNHEDEDWLDYWRAARQSQPKAGEEGDQAGRSRQAEAEIDTLYWQLFQHYWFYRWQQQSTVRRQLREDRLDDAAAAGDDKVDSADEYTTLTHAALRTVSRQLLDQGLAALELGCGQTGFAVDGLSRHQPSDASGAASIRALNLQYVDMSKLSRACVDQPTFEAISSDSKSAVDNSSERVSSDSKSAVDQQPERLSNDSRSAGDQQSEQERAALGEAPMTSSPPPAPTTTSEPTAATTTSLPPAAAPAESDTAAQVGKPAEGVPIKYWMQRKRLFSRFNQGIKMDSEAWFSTTVERIAEHHARRCSCDVVVDACCGVGGNAIQLAMTCNHVIAVDLDPLKIEYAQHNASIYNVAHKINFVVGDFRQVAQSLKQRVDVVFLSPPWGGPEYLQRDTYDLQHVTPAIEDLMQAARRLSPNICLYLPRQTNVAQIIELAQDGEVIELQQDFINQKLKTLTIYFNQLSYS